jgi:hypothetical protein
MYEIRALEPHWNVSQKRWMKFAERRAHIFGFVYPKYTEIQTFYSTFMRRWFCETRAYKMRKHTEHDGYQFTIGTLVKAVGWCPIKMHNDRTITAVPPKKRVVCKPTLKSLNAKIKAVREQLRVRSRLGAFDKTLIGPRVPFIASLLAIDENDISTFNNLVGACRDYGRFSKKLSDLQRFEQALRSHRVELKELVGAVKYEAEKP